MILVKHENFPDAHANLIRHFEYQVYGETCLKFPEEIYGNGVSPKEWIECVGKQSAQHRPLILSMDSGIKGNSLTAREMKASK